MTWIPAIVALIATSLHTCALLQLTPVPIQPLRKLPNYPDAVFTPVSVLRHLSALFLQRLHLNIVLMSRTACYADYWLNEISFKHSIQLWLAWGRQALVDSERAWLVLFFAIAQ